MINQEQCSQQRFDEDKEKYRMVSDDLCTVYSEILKRFLTLQKTEEYLSSQKGLLSSELHQQEIVLEKFSTCARNNVDTTNKIFSRNPDLRLNVNHHYHMRCLKHEFGQHQPHILEIAEKMPGYLRIFSFARRSTLFQQTLFHAYTRANNTKKVFTEKIQEVDEQLRLTKAELREVGILLHAIKQNKYMMQNPDKFNPSSLQSYDHSIPINRYSNPRMHYLNSLQISSVDGTILQHKKDISNKVRIQDERERILSLLKQLKIQFTTHKQVKQESQFFEDYRSRFRGRLPESNSQKWSDSSNNVKGVTINNSNNPDEKEGIAAALMMQNILLDRKSEAKYGIDINRNRKFAPGMNGEWGIVKRNKQSPRIPQAMFHSPKFTGFIK